jgi:hypothetical protein
MNGRRLLCRAAHSLSCIHDGQPRTAAGAVVGGRWPRAVDIAGPPTAWHWPRAHGHPLEPAAKLRRRCAAPCTPVGGNLVVPAWSRRRAVCCRRTLGRSHDRRRPCLPGGSPALCKEVQ